jgi:RNA polymerase sigma factor (TIGR02999 family)
VAIGKKNGVGKRSQWLDRQLLDILRFMSDVTRIISEIISGQTHASEELLPLVYRELRSLAARQLRQRSPDDSIQATELVHEAFLRLVDSSQQQEWDSRGHFFSAAAESMRRILVERARKKSRIKHGGKLKPVDKD